MEGLPECRVSSDSTQGNEFSEGDQSVSDIFADSDSSKVDLDISLGDISNCDTESEDIEVASDAHKMKLHVQSGYRSDIVKLTLLEKNGTKVGTVNTKGQRVLSALRDKGLKVMPFYGNPPPVDKNGKLVLGKHHRLKSGTRSLREIRKYQRSTKTLVPKAVFKRLIREVRSDLHLDCSFAKETYEALQEAAERYCVEIFNVANRIATHSKRVTLYPKDIELALEILMKPWDCPGNNNGFTA